MLIYELTNYNKIPFLDALVDTNNDTSPYKEATSINACTLKYKTECFNYYKLAIIRNFITLTKANSSTRNI